MSDTNQPPTPPQDPSVPPPASDADTTDAAPAAPEPPAPFDGDASSSPAYGQPIPPAPAYDPSGYYRSAQPDADTGGDTGAYQQAPQQSSSDSSPYQQPAQGFDPNAYPSQQAPQQQPFDPNAYPTQQAPQPPAFDPNAYQQAPAYPAAGYPAQGGGYTGGPGYGVAPAGYNPNYDPQAKSRVVAGILGILLGAFGVHRFYLGYTGMGILMLGLYLLGLISSIFLVGFFLVAGVGIWGLVEGILILTRSQNFRTDATGRPLRDG